MRYVVCILLSLTVALVAQAQTPWSRLPADVQQSVVASRRTPELVRRVMLGDPLLAHVEGALREELLRCVTSKCGDEGVVSLNIYLYNLLRMPDGAMAEEDMRMLSLYPEALLELFALSDDLLASYAYSLGRAKAHSDAKRCGRVIRKLSKRRYAERYGRTVARLSQAVDVVYRSESASQATFEDVTPAARSPRYVELSSEEEYLSQHDGVGRLVCENVASGGSIEPMMREECMTWGRGYHTLFKCDMARNISLVHSACSDGDFLTLIDSDGVSFTFADELYITKSRAIIAVDRRSEYPSITIGTLSPHGVMHIEGRVIIDLGREIEEVRCTEDYLYIKASRDSAMQYLKVYMGK